MLFICHSRLLHWVCKAIVLYQIVISIFNRRYFFENDDISFCIQARLPPEHSNVYAFFNSRINGRWAKEKKLSPFPFAKNQRFILRLILTAPNTLTVDLDGEQTLYTYNSGFLDVTHAKVYGAIMLERIDTWCLAWDIRGVMRLVLEYVVTVWDPPERNSKFWKIL